MSLELEIMLKKFFSSAFAALLLLSSCQRSVPAASCLPCPTTEPCVEQKCFHKYGNEVQPDYWVDCGRNGQLITTQRNGVVITQSYANGMLNGQSTFSYPHSEQAERVEMYENDQMVSQTFYQQSGMPINSIEYSSPDISTETIWYENGNPKSTEKYERGMLVSGEYYDLQNNRDAWVSDGYGERNSRDSLGSLVSLDTFRNGELTSKVIQYPNGTPKEVIAIANGQINGERKTYYPGGEPMSIEFWNNGQQHGLTTIYQNGEKYAEVPYNNGRKHGVERRYRDGSNVTQEINWNNDQMHGQSNTYYGDSVQTDWYYNGRLSTRSNFESFAVPKKGS